MPDVPQLVVITTCPSDTFFLLANQSLDPDLQTIASDYIVHYDYGEVLPPSRPHHPPPLHQALANVTQTKVVMAEARQLLDFFRRKDFTNEFGESSMHIMKVTGVLLGGMFGLLQECLFPFGVAFALQKDSPYTNKFDWS